ncbi:MAG: O-antigen ligase family protein [Thermomicrobium sp.]
MIERPSPVLYALSRGRRIASRWADSTKLLTCFFLVMLAALAAGLPFGIAVSLLGAMVILAVWRPRAALLAVPATIPFAPFRAAIGGASFSVLELALVFAVGSISVREVWSCLRAHSLRHPLSKARALASHATFAPLALALLVVGTASLGLVADPSHVRESLREWRWVIVEPIGYYIAALWLLHRPDDGRQLLGVWIGASVLAAIVCVTQWFSGGGLTVEGVRRLTGFYPHPNAAALALERPALLALAIGFGSLGRSRYVWWCSGTVIGVATILTFSRGAMLALLLGMAAVLWSLHYRRWFYGLVLTSFLVVLWGVISFPERLRAGLWAGGEALRLAIWRSTLAMISDRPLTGVGLDQFLYQYAPRYIDPAAWPERFTSHPHNLFLDVWVTFGTNGIFLLASAVWLVSKTIRRRLVWPLDFAVGISLLGGLVHGLVDRGFFTPELSLTFWLAAVILDMPRTARSAATETGGKPCECW